MGTITNTTRFLLPLLENKKFILKGNFINTYISHIDNPKYDNHLLVVYNDDLMPRYSIHSLYIDSIYEKWAHIDIYKIPKSFQKNYTYFLNGEYKKFTQKYKQIILEYWNNDIVMQQILNEDTHIDLQAKTHYVNFHEYWSKPIITEEIYGFN